ncbi:hypothetical protein [Comamonas jiangduensis]|uniref:hypothetical protein n=1 Tax=Comamonas jiangduensis TaxID=1194168 RepID=UPI003BF7B7CC
MGQAKNRGSQDARIAEAIKRERAKFPETVKCNSCQKDLSEITPMDIRGFTGLRAAGAAACSDCQSTTWVMDGTPEAMAEVAEMLEQEHGSEGILGWAPAPKTQSA